MTLMPAVSSWLQTTRSRLTLLFGGTAVLAGLAIGLVADQVLTRHLTELSGQSLVSASQPIALALAQGMQEREREIALLSYLPMLTRDDGYAPQLQAHLEQIRQSYPFYSWIGVTDAQGVVQVSTGNLLRGQNVSQRPWFSAGQQGPYVGDAHDAVLLDKLLRAPGSPVPLRFMDYASPVRGQDSVLKGVVSAHVNWAWVQDIIRRATPQSPMTGGLEVLLVNKDGVINTAGAVEQARAALPILPSQGTFQVMSWGDDPKETYLTAVVPVRAQTVTDLGWMLVTRQPLEMALAPINRLHTLLALLLGLMAALLVALAYWAARRFSQPVERLAEAARQVQASGQVAALDFEMDTVEFQHLRSALQNMTQGLIDGKAALEQANAELEHRVIERTQALQQSEQRYLSILEDQTEIICRFDADNRMTFVNDAFCRLFHLRREDVLGRVWSPIVYPDDLPLVTQKLAAIHPRNPLVVIENRVVSGDGSIRWCQFSNRALFDDSGQLVEWQSVGRDITERRQLEAELAQASEQFQDLYDHAPCGYYALDGQGKYVHLNLLTLQWLGLPREEVIGKLGPADFFDDEGKALFTACFPVFLQTGKIGPLEFNLCGRGGVQRRVSVSSTAILDAQGDYVMSRSIMYDVSELHAARQQLHTLNLEQQAMLDNDLIGIAKVKDRVIVWRNPALERIFGYAPGTLQGRTTEEMYVDQEDFLAFGRDAYAVLASGQHYRQQRRMRRVTGEMVWIDVNGVLLEGQGESLWLMQDITAMKQYQEQVEHIAFHDGLTHLPNRLLLADRMAQAFALSDRTQTQAAVCYLDLNGFKPINDRYGHDMGDEVLRVTARRLLKQVRGNDTAARIGGDEFVLVLTAVKDPAEVDQALRRVMAAIEQPIDLGEGRVVSVSAAVGTALYPRDGTTTFELLRAADQAMYADKGHVSAERSL
ncbi:MULTISPECIES: PAS domain S-box protein [unclassified Acidovorax]|uniref:PAS domain S-box protein n=1 Tax=unclassified Acidovorax TaxID=2684926 RepID=UPI000C17979A|nr:MULTISPECIES: PAS domain S-box protein [unclassified Acidovorax]PIF18046.1 PAS domain S-box-containing protein/diguanylate cyclase (GGDEF)-like protein [Acidovorax sp. 59]PKW02929.1 PAS domain S-box-containing protein/diguanylate cyclase (GGDEF)-like protein [Acidovorax sp. 30]